MTINDEVKAQIAKYESLPDGKELLNYIRKVINEKGDSWDHGTQNSSDNLLAMLLFEYATGINKITEGIINPKFVIDKLRDSLGTVRFGDFKKGLDDNITYGSVEKNGEKKPLSVTEEQYSINCRVKSNFGAHAPTYVDSTGNNKTALVLFEAGQNLPDGTKLSGIDLNKLNDIRHTIFHELTHTMEKNIVPRRELESKDIVFDQGEQGSIFLNYMESADYDGLDYYIESIRKTLQSKDEVTFSGISTIEINNRKSKNRIMRNQISEGATELISNLVMDANGFEISEENKDRYNVQREIIRRVFDHRGSGRSIADYLYDSHRLISYMESVKVRGGKDFLHYADEFVHANYDLGKDIQDHTSVEEPVSGRIQKMYNMLWSGGLAPDQKQLFKILIMKEVLNNYTGTLNGRNDFIRRLKEKMDFADEFGNVLEEHFPLRKKTEQDCSERREVEDEER